MAAALLHLENQRNLRNLRHPSPLPHGFKTISKSVKSMQSVAFPVSRIGLVKRTDTLRGGRRITADFTDFSDSYEVARGVNAGSRGSEKFVGFE
jgi:hypothetical protein